MSRGGLKLERALDEFAVAVGGRVAIDVGASTGGFTDCLLQRGAARVYAVDVGYGQLAWKLREDPRVVNLERTNIRDLTADRLPERPDLAVIDASFISLDKVLPPTLALLAADAEVLALIKPQFEVGRGEVGKGGVVRESGEARPGGEQGPGAGRGTRLRGAGSHRKPHPRPEREQGVSHLDAKRSYKLQAAS